MKNQMKNRIGVFLATILLMFGTVSEVLASPTNTVDFSKMYAETAYKPPKSKSTVSVINFPRLTNETDDTARINRALQSGADTVIIPDGDYWINGWAEGSWTDFVYGGISLESNQSLRMGSKANLRLIPNDKQESAIIRVTGKENVYISGGQLHGDRYTHKGTLGQWGMGVSVTGSKNVTIENTVAKDNWGDGFFIGHTPDAKPSENVNLYNVHGHNNRRQGLSVVASADGGVYNSKFTKTNGHSPEAGIDLEANPGKTVVNFKIVNCELKDNEQQGIQVSADVHYSKIVGNKIFNNKGNGVYVWDGDNQYIAENQIIDNKSNGIFLIRSNDSTVRRNKVQRNNYHGVLIGESNNNSIAGNDVKENSQLTHNYYSNILLWDANDNILRGNKTRAGLLPNKPMYGIRINSKSSHRNILVQNDTFKGGILGGLSTIGTATDTKGENRLNKGNWSTKTD